MMDMRTAYAASVSDLRLKFPGESSLVFKDLIFVVPKGQKVLLLGPSGCGKSTLLQVLSGLIPNSIEVPMKCAEIEHPQSWGFVFQDPDTQFCMPYVDEELAFVLENLSVPREKMELLIQDALARVGLGWDDLHVPIQTLSQGMKQRLALASVLLLEPDVLFLDEPSALLDPEGTKQIWDSVRRITKGQTVLIVEHKIEEIADFVDRVVLFDSGGAIIADGAPDEVFDKCKDKLTEYGIWYPDVWEDYVQTQAYRNLTAADSRSDSAIAREPLASLRDFAGYRGKERKIAVREADVYPGDWIAVIGPNGAGKSTLLQSLMRLLPTTGLYELRGADATDRKRRLSDDIAFVFQNPELQFVTNSVYDEVAHSLRISPERFADVDGKVKATLLDFGLPDDPNRHPYQLSLGQKRRLSVASAMIMEQSLLLLDEPTFGQDARNTFAILERLERRRSSGAAIIMVTHDTDIVRRFATKVWTIEQGILTNISATERGMANR